MQPVDGSAGSPFMHLEAEFEQGEISAQNVWATALPRASLEGCNHAFNICTCGKEKLKQSSFSPLGRDVLIEVPFLMSRVLRFMSQ